MYAALVEYFRTHRMSASRIIGWGGTSILLVADSAWEHTWVEFATFFAGVVLVGVATVGRLWCAIYISGYKNSRLITVGPYSLTRNPLYFCSALGFIGLALATETVVLALLVAGLLTILTPHVIAREERHLAAQFGAAFADYCARTPRFWPRLADYVEPETWTVSTRIVRRRLADSLWFVWGVGFIELIEAFHELNRLPTLFHLY